MSLIKKYDGTTFNNVYATNCYDGTNQKNKNVKPFDNTVIYFDGNEDYITTPSSSDFGFDNGNFTIELQYKPILRVGTYPNIFYNGLSWGVNEFGLCDRHIGYPTVFTFFVYNINSGDYLLKSTTPIVNGTWYHLAVVRNGTSLKLYVNGIVEASVTTSVSLDGGISTFFNFGGSTGNYVNAQMTNIRISKGIARYTSTFTPSKIIPELDSYTKLLITGESPIADKTGKAITVNGNTTVSNSYNAVYTDSCNAIYFNGTSNLTLADSGDWTFGTGDFTIEFWTRNTSGGLYLGQIASNGYHVTTNFFISNDGNNKIIFTPDYRLYPNQHYLTSTIITADNIWHHVAVVRNGAYFRMYVDGVETGTALNFGTGFAMTDSGETLKIGWMGPPENYMSYTGYMTNIRISKGIARYTSNFNPFRTRMLVDSYTKLLITGESPIIDKTGKTVTVNGGAFSTKITV